MIKKTGLWGFALVMAIMFVWPSIAGAHAYLDRSNPIQNAELEESPREIWVQFTEPIDTQVSQLRLEDEEGQVIQTEQYSEDDLSLTLSLPEVGDGVYHVYWQVLSLDTHVTDGSFRFAVGTELPQDRPDETIFIDDTLSGEAGDEQPLTGYDRLNALLRSVEIVTVMVLGGWIFFHGLLWNKEGDRFLIVRKSSHPSQTDEVQNRNMNERVLYLSAFVIFLISGAGHILLRSWPLSGGAWTDPGFWETVVVIATSTVIGMASGLPPLFILVLFGLTWARKPRIGIKSILIVALVASLVYSGHAYQSNMIPAHTLHILTTIIWFSGLLGFTIYSFRIKKSKDALHYVHQRLTLFSTLALAMVILISVTGIMLSMVYLDSWSDLTESRYGVTLLWKIGIFSLALVIAAFHRFVWLPNLQKVTHTKERVQQLTFLLWGLRIELVMVIIVFILAGIVATTAPPADIHQGHSH